MPSYDPNSLSPLDRYRFLIGSVVPRPIAWVRTCDNEGRENLAPFSFFSGVCSSPPIVQISIGPRKVPKDTLANLQANGEAVVHLPTSDNIDAVQQSGGEYKVGCDEAMALDLPTTASDYVRPSRLIGIPVALECKLIESVKLGDPASTVCFLQVLYAHVDDAIAAEDGLPDPHKLTTLARLGGRSYLASHGWQVSDQSKAVVPPELAR